MDDVTMHGSRGSDNAAISQSRKGQSTILESATHGVDFKRVIFGSTCRMGIEYECLTTVAATALAI
jgi:hypothetical protein